MWEVYTVNYAQRNARTRADSFLFDERHGDAHAMEYYFWVLKKGKDIILVDTGYDHKEANRRGRPIRLTPKDALLPLGIEPAHVHTVICTHLHYDHAGGMHLFPNATVHLQSAEMAYATGPCMCHGVLRAPYTADHVKTAIEKLYSDKLVFHTGDTQLVDGVSLHQVGGHSRGLQVVRVLTDSGWLVLASDASHYYENFLHKKLFPIVVDAEDMLKGFTRIQNLAQGPELVIPGHDPLVMDYFPESHAPFIRRLDKGVKTSCPL